MIKCYCTFNRLQHKHNFYVLGNQKIYRTYYIALYGGGLEPNPQYL